MGYEQLQKIIEKGGDFVVGLKKNQPSLYQAVHDYSKEHGEKPCNLIGDAFDESHGRLVRRRYFAWPLAEEVKPLAL